MLISGCSEGLDDSFDSTAANPGSGKGGSLARFAVVDDALYTVHNRSLTPYALLDPANPRAMSSINLNFDVETIFPRDDSTLFMGTTTGMIIYDISDKLFPRYISEISHVVSCDPVVANEDYAYVTLRADNQGPCFRGTNQLDIVDIQSLYRPRLIRSYPMSQPKGLGLYGDTLLVCDRGVKVFDVSDPLALKLLDYDETIPAVDIIPVGNIMIIATENGLVQYRYHKTKLERLSSL